MSAAVIDAALAVMVQARRACRYAREARAQCRAVRAQAVTLRVRSFTMSRGGRPIQGGSGRDPAILIPLTGVRVLVIEDHDDTRELWRTVLDSAGAHVAVADSPEAGLAAARSFAPAVVLSDISFAGRPVDARGLVAQLRAHRTTTQAIVIAVTGRTTDGLLDAGFDEVVRKPVDPQALCAVVASVTGRGRA